MEHKPIYLDGVDVRNCKGIDLSLSPLVKCKFLKFKTSDGGIAGIWCSDHTNCCFKQLARKTQEFEQLQEKYEALKLENQEGYEIVAELKQECEKLKKELNGSEKWRIKAESLNEKLDIKNTRYLKALEEIEEHYKKVIKNLTTCDDSHDANISIEALHNISDIINKAKGQ